MIFRYQLKYATVCVLILCATLLLVPAPPTHGWSADSYRITQTVADLGAGVRQNIHL
jgi:hypothetical protein